MRFVLEGIAANKRVVNAYIFYGTNFDNLLKEARYYATCLNCKNTQNKLPCGTCKQCSAILAGSYVDSIELHPEKGLLIEDIRRIQETVKYGPNESAYQVVIVQHAEKMNTQAANAFLKTLEEPHSQVVFILLCNHFSNLLPTIVSRCQTLGFSAAPKSYSDIDELISFQNYRSMEITEQFEFNAIISKDTARLPIQLEAWIAELSALQSPKTQPDIDGLIKIMSRLDSNLNQRLQLDAFVTGLK